MKSGTAVRARLGARVVCLWMLVAPSSAPVLAADREAADPPMGTELVLRALSLLGVNYRFGGNSPDGGLDCSGLVRHVFQETLGRVLPRRSEEISREGQPIDAGQLKPGDLVFFNTVRRTFSHVGIYIGNGQFVHAPSTGGQVRVEALGAQYWARRFDGARRLLSAERDRAIDTPILEQLLAGIPGSSLGTTARQASLRAGAVLPAAPGAPGQASAAAAPSPSAGADPIRAAAP